MRQPYGPPEDPDQDQEPKPSGSLRPTGPGPLIAFALTGLVLGWVLRPIGVWMTGTAPLVGWLPVLALLFVALIIATVAWLTYRTLHRRHERIEAHRAVNRLVLAKSCALAGSLVGGGYLGYALSFLGMTESALMMQRAIQALCAGGAAALLVAGALLLERACRVSDDDDADLP